MEMDLASHIISNLKGIFNQVNEGMLGSLVDVVSFPDAHLAIFTEKNTFPSAVAGASS